MNRITRCALAVCTFSLAAFNANAQKSGATTVESLGEGKVPWTVAIAPSANTVAVGNCQLVYIELTDETGKDRPRRPGGMRVGLADFDWTATGEQPNAAVGIYDGPNAWSVCACQGAVVGSSITITATYPAASLPEKVRVPGLAFRSTTHLPIHAPYGTSNPKGCDAPPPAAPVAVVGALAPPTMASLPGRTLPPSAVPVSAPANTRPSAPSNPTGPPPPSGIATPPAAGSAPAGPTPSFVHANGNPAEAVVTWSAPATYNTPAPVEYIVDRSLQSNPATIIAQSPSLTVREWHDTQVSSGTWIYRVTAIYADGRRGSAGTFYTYVDPSALQNVQSEQVGRDSVSITWSPMMGAAYYYVTGPPTMATRRVDSAHVMLPGISLGPQTWQVSAVYVGKGANPTPRSGPATATSVELVRRRYRLVAEALRVTTETADQQFSADGKYDEVFVAAVAERVNRQSGTRIDISPAQVSALHGDVSNWPPPQRVKAGTASGWGGIQHGNVVSPIWSAPTASAPMGTPVFVLWEGELIGGKQDLLLHPIVIESDEPDANARAIAPSYAICHGLACSWSRYFTGPGGGGYASAAMQAAASSPQIRVEDGKQMFLTGSGYFVHLENQDRDRPIGLTVEDRAEPNVGLVGMWRDKVVALNREKIEAALASGQNKIEVRFWDHWNKTGVPLSTVDYLNGDYTLVIRMERAP